MPHCNKWTPLIGSFWLARVKDSKGRYTKLAWFDYVKNENGELDAHVYDLNKETHKIELPTLADRKILIFLVSQSPHIASDISSR
jgi:adenine-specific DNA methylase